VDWEGQVDVHEEEEEEEAHGTNQKPRDDLCRAA
jgi:hypothetical protein